MADRIDATNDKLSDHFQIHSLELSKYNFAGLDPSSLSMLEQWIFGLQNSSRLDVSELRRLLPEPAN